LRHEERCVKSRIVGRVEQGPEGSVYGGIVGGVGLPTVPDHLEPRAGEDADGVRLGRVRGCRRDDIDDIGGDQGLALQEPSAKPQMASLNYLSQAWRTDGAYFARLAGRGRHAGQQAGPLGVESRSAFAELGQKACSATSSRMRHAGEHMRVNESGGLFADLLHDEVEIGDQRRQTNLAVTPGHRECIGGRSKITDARMVPSEHTLPTPLYPPRAHGCFAIYSIAPHAGGCELHPG